MTNMLKSTLRVLGRTLLILLAAAIVSGIAYGLSTTTSGSTQRFRTEGEQRFEQPSAPGVGNQTGQPARSTRGREERDGFRENGSLTRGLFQVFTNILLVSLFTGLGLLLFKRNKNRIPARL